MLRSVAWIPLAITALAAGLLFTIGEEGRSQPAAPPKGLVLNNVTLYTIQVNTGGDPTSTLLQNCASDSSKFFLLTSASQIVATFNQIGTNLAQLRISK